MSHRVETLATADLPAFHELGQLAFGHTRPFNQDALGSADHFLGIRSGNGLAATAAVIPAGQWFGGNLVDGSAVGGVSVAPHLRGQGLGGALVGGMLDKMAADGVAISSLYPTTALLYRKFGWEFAGSFDAHRIDMHRLRTDGPTDLEVSQAEPGNYDDIKAVHAAMGAATNGWLSRTDQWWTRVGARMRPEHRAYFHVFRRRGNPVAYTRLSSTKPETTDFGLVGHDIAAIDGAAMRGVARFLSGFDMVAKDLTTTLPLRYLGDLTAQPQLATCVDRKPWMTRIVNAAAAVEQRGWPVSVAGEVHLDIVDPTLPSNAGPQVFRIADGAATLEPGGSGNVNIHIGQLASWFTGFTPASSLSWQGLLTGANADDIALLDAAVAGPQPCLSEYF